MNNSTIIPLVAVTAAAAFGLGWVARPDSTKSDQAAKSEDSNSRQRVISSDNRGSRGGETGGSAESRFLSKYLQNGEISSEDMAAAIKELSETNDPLLRQKMLALLLEKLTPENARDAFLALQKNRRGGPMGRGGDDELRLLANAWGRIDGAGAIAALKEIAESMGDEGGRGRGGRGGPGGLGRELISALSGWATADSAAAIAHFEGLEDGMEKRFGAAGIIQGMLVNGVDDAMSFVQSLPESEGEGREKGFYMSMIASEMIEQGLDTAKSWLIEQGMEAMDGPINFGDKNQFWGLLIQNFTSPNSYGMNYNPPYYRALFERYGFQTYFEQYVYSRPLKQPVEEIFARKARSVMNVPGIRVSDVRGYSTERIAKDFLQVYNGAWGGHAGFKAMTEPAALKVAKSLKPIMDPEIIVFVYADDEPIAFYVNIPELNEIFCHVDGNLNWLGKLKFLYHKWRKTPKTMVGIVFGVVRSWHGKGIEAALIQWFGDHKVGRVAYETTILTWIGDFNPKMIRVAENLGTEVYRTYITYRYLFDRDKKFERCPIVQ